jgi:hypothetical protein
VGCHSAVGRFDTPRGLLLLPYDHGVLHWPSITITQPWRRRQEQEGNNKRQFEGRGSRLEARVRGDFFILIGGSRSSSAFYVLTAKREYRVVLPGL